MKKGASEPRAAGEIHTDMERGFIKAEIYSCNELLNSGSELALKNRKNPPRRKKLYDPGW